SADYTAKVVMISKDNETFICNFVLFTLLELFLTLCVFLFIGHRTFKRWLAPTLREIKRRKDKMGPQPPLRRSTFLEWNYQAELFAFGKRLNEQFAEEALQQAFTDRSYIVQEETRLRDLNIESPQLSLTDNWPLVEVGEQLTSDTVYRCLRASLPYVPEECISCAANYLMSEDVLARVSSGIGTRDLILSADFPPEAATLARSLKAVVGALEKSCGQDRAAQFVMDLVVSQLCGRNVYEMWSPEDPLALVTAIMSRRGGGSIEPRLLGKAAPNTILAVYRVGIYSDKQFLGSGV
ncbi:hypothetical protein PR048_008347, partial [Dryococelus australis]